MDAKSNKSLHVTEKCSVDDNTKNDQQYNHGSFWGFQFYPVSKKDSVK